jgi:hypothetical protein
MLVGDGQWRAVLKASWYTDLIRALAAPLKPREGGRGEGRPGVFADEEAIETFQSLAG